MPGRDGRPRLRGYQLTRLTDLGTFVKFIHFGDEDVAIRLLLVDVDVAASVENENLKEAASGSSPFLPPHRVIEIQLCLFPCECLCLVKGLLQKAEHLDSPCAEAVFDLLWALRCFFFLHLRQLRRFFGFFALSLCILWHSMVFGHNDVLVGIRWRSIGCRFVGIRLRNDICSIFRCLHFLRSFLRSHGILRLRLQVARKQFQQLRRHPGS
mmetsp:Transcript_14516/g.24764  ORF Transcript_14516/g.24764 Transcript_14516/m.24764 type:complete len:211 (+) Transcript_14516:205-837(+)